MTPAFQPIDPLLAGALETVRAYGSPAASEFASRIQFASGSIGVGFECEEPRETVGELLETARDALRRNAAVAACLQAVEAVPDCAEKHYLTAVALLRSEDSHTVGEVPRQEIERALTLDPGNPVYLKVAGMIDAEYADREENTRSLRKKSARLVEKLGRKTGIGR